MNTRRTFQAQNIVAVPVNAHCAGGEWLGQINCEFYWDEERFVFKGLTSEDGTGLTTEERAEVARAAKTKLDSFRPGAAQAIRATETLENPLDAILAIDEVWAALAADVSMAESRTRILLRSVPEPNLGVPLLQVADMLAPLCEVSALLGSVANRARFLVSAFLHEYPSALPAFETTGFRGHLSIVWNVESDELLEEWVVGEARLPWPGICVRRFWRDKGNAVRSDGGLSHIQSKMHHSWFGLIAAVKKSRSL